MIGINQKVKWGMGNCLFTWHFVRQMANYLKAPYFGPDWRDKNYFEGMIRVSRPFKLFRRDFKITSRMIRSLPTGEILRLCRENLFAGRDILFVPPLLGETFFSYTFTAPSSLVRINPSYCQSVPGFNNDRPLVGLHFRGGDFSAWNPNAVLPTDYYLEAIECFLAEYPDSAFFLCTDDETCPAWSPVLKRLFALPRERIYFGLNDAPPIYDLHWLSLCDGIISSPSTFAIWAGILGRSRKKIIHSKKWVDLCVARQDVFWCRLDEGGNDFYKLWKTV